MVISISTTIHRHTGTQWHIFSLQWITSRVFAKLSFHSFVTFCVKRLEFYSNFFSSWNAEHNTGHSHMLGKWKKKRICVHLKNGKYFIATETWRKLLCSDGSFFTPYHVCLGLIPSVLGLLGLSNKHLQQTIILSFVVVKFWSTNSHEIKFRRTH